MSSAGVTINPMPRPSPLPPVKPSDSAMPGLTHTVPARAAHAVASRLRRAQLPTATATPRDLAYIKQQIADDLASFDALHVIATLMVSSMACDRSGDFEPAATMEYAASVLLERPDQTPIRSSPPDELAKNAAIQRALDRVRGLTLHGVIAGRRAAARAGSAIEAIAESLKAVDTVNRWPGYETQIVDFMADTFSDPAISQHLSVHLGFNAAQAIACDRAIRELLSGNFEEWRAHVPKAVQSAIDLWDSGQLPTPPGLELRGGNPPEQRFWWLLAQYLTSDRLLDVLSFDDAELADTAQVSQPVAAAFIERFTSPWGTARGLTLLSGRNEVRRRPLLRSKSGRTHPTAPGNVLWALRPAMEAELKKDRAVFETYQSARATRTERDAARHFKHALAPDSLLTNITFNTSDAGGEADVLVRV